MKINRRQNERERKSEMHERQQLERERERESMDGSAVQGEMTSQRK